MRLPCSSRTRVAVAAIIVCVAAFTSDAHASTGLRTAFKLPSAGQLWSLLILEDYNARVVVLGVAMLGAASGLIGSFMLLRKRALLGDALSHATLPGIGIAFLLMTHWGMNGKYLPGLLLGAAIAGSIGVALILGITKYSRIKQDAALGIVLSVFFGLGVAVLGIVQQSGSGNAAGLESFIYGKTASMLRSDAMAIAVMAAIIGATCVICFKEFQSLCFDQEYAATTGLSVVLMDVAMMAMVVGVTVVGLQAVGLILMIALLIIPAAAARFWTNNLPTMMIAAGLIGALSGWVGAGVSALFGNLPAGALIVLVSGVFFGISMVFGPARGLLGRIWEHVSLTRRVAQQHLIRAIYEHCETAPDGSGDVDVVTLATHVTPISDLRQSRSWSASELQKSIRVARRAGLVRDSSEPDCIQLTERGAHAARRVVRNHRLWEMYLITYADIAPSHVDRDADEVEHVLGPELIRRLETLLAREQLDLTSPQSPHLLDRASLPGHGGAL